ncbi:hypothetical protein [Dokdonella soli]|uniref:Metallothionein n=1 Tax=Dokdonella soli TaxID=529810 RepID=A0ABN1IFH1_9GAMM
MQIEQHKCSHRPCQCVVGSDTAYCSPQCEEQAALGTAAAVCECGHADCEQNAGIGAEPTIT